MKRHSRAIHGLFAELVAPKFVPWLDPNPTHAELQKVEDLKRKLCKCGDPDHWDAVHACTLIDTKAHIDYVLRTSDGLVRGIGARISYWQAAWDSRWPFNCFTERAWTPSGRGVEIDDIRRAISHWEEGLMFPGYLVHAYINGAGEKPRVDSVGMVRTVDVYRYIDAPPPGSPPLRIQPVKGGAGMAKVPWVDLRNAGVKIWQWPEPMSEAAA